MVTPLIVTHKSKRFSSIDAAIEYGKATIEEIVGKPPRHPLDPRGYFEYTGPVKGYTIGKSSNGRKGLVSRGSTTYNHCIAIVELTITDGKGADGRNIAIESALIQHFKDDPRCLNINSGGGGQTSKSATDRNIYIAIEGDEDRIDELEDALKPKLAN